MLLLVTRTLKNKLMYKVLNYLKALDQCRLQMFQLHNVTYVHTLCKVSGYKHITFDGLLLEEKSNFSCCYIYNRLWISFSDRYTIKSKDDDNDDGKQSEDKIKA